MDESIDTRDANPDFARVRNLVRIADLEIELSHKDERIADLKAELDEKRSLCERLEQYTKEDEEFLEQFCHTYGLVRDEDGKWTNGEFLEEVRQLADVQIDLITRHNKLVGLYNRHCVAIPPPGRPIAASEAQQAAILKHHKAGKSSRWIAAELSLSRRTVTTVTTKAGGTDRTTARHRQRLGLEPKRKDWRIAARQRLPKAAIEHFRKGKELLKEAKGLAHSAH
jgi:hypothetical protein